MCGLFPSEYTIYVIMVLWEGVEWQIRKRYSEFRYLHDFLLSKFGNRLGKPIPNASCVAARSTHFWCSLSLAALSGQKLQSHHAQGTEFH
jgi:hypothetical protein